MDDLQFEQLLAVLTEIREGQRELFQALLAPIGGVEEVEPPCQHPPDLRSDQRHGAPFWKCNGCGFVYDRETATV